MNTPVTEEEYLAWLENPVTELYHQYLSDLVEEFAKEERPVVYPQGLDDLIQMGTRCSIAGASISVLTDLSELQFEDIHNFYETEEEG